MAAPMRTTTNKTRVKSTRFLSSGILNVFVKAEIMDYENVVLARGVNRALRLHSTTGNCRHFRVNVPPAFSIFSLAEALALLATIAKLLVISPTPRILIPSIVPRTK